VRRDIYRSSTSTVRFRRDLDCSFVEWVLLDVLVLEQRRTEDVVECVVEVEEDEEDRKDCNSFCNFCF
jgi:hypothetical protein